MIHCDPYSELSQRDSLDEGSQHMVAMRSTKNDHQILRYLEFCVDKLENQRSGSITWKHNFCFYILYIK